MTAVTLPTTPGAIAMTPRLITSRSESQPAFGTPDQRFSRMGSRYAFDVQLEPMTTEEAMDWVNIETEDETCIWTIPQVEFDTGAPGQEAKVDGAGQTGTTLNLKGVTPGYPIRKGQWLNVTTSGVVYLYRAAAEVTADEAGDVAVLLTTMLRKPHLDNDAVELAQPKVEGFVTLPEDAWAIAGEDRLIRLSFTIKERA